MNQEKIRLTSEKEKMLRGELYNASDPQLCRERRRARILLRKFNRSADEEIDLRHQVLGELLSGQGTNLIIEPPFYCDYGSHITVGDNVFFNFNCVVLDVTYVIVGNNTLFGPAVQIYTATHPMNWKERAAGLEYGKPVSIGSDVWVGGGAIVCPGVTIGDRSVIGAGSVVTKHIPADVFAAGNPCRVIKSL